MAGSSQKKIHAQNQKIMRTHVITTLVIASLFSLYRIYYHWQSIGFIQLSLFIITTVSYFLIVRTLSNQATPYTDEKGNLHVTVDLAKISGSLSDYLFDILYVQWFCQVVGLLTDYVWFVYLVIPIFAIYKAVNFALPMLRGGMPGMPGMPGFQSGADADPTAFMSPQEKKKYEKKKRQDEVMQKRMKNVRM
jgi:hypothetical protein